jgi:hypothetical protein
MESEVASAIGRIQSPRLEGGKKWCYLGARLFAKAERGRGPKMLNQVVFERKVGSRAA